MNKCFILSLFMVLSVQAEAPAAVLALLAGRQNCVPKSPRIVSDEEARMVAIDIGHRYGLAPNTRFVQVAKPRPSIWDSLLTKREPAIICSDNGDSLATIVRKALMSGINPENIRFGNLIKFAPKRNPYYFPDSGRIGFDKNSKPVIFKEYYIAENQDGKKSIVSRNTLNKFYWDIAGYVLKCTTISRNRFQALHSKICKEVDEARKKRAEEQ